MLTIINIIVRYKLELLQSKLHISLLFFHMLDCAHLNFAGIGEYLK